MRSHLSAIFLGIFTASATFYGLHIHRVEMKRTVQIAIDNDVQIILHAESEAERQKAKAHLQKLTDQAANWE